MPTQQAARRPRQISKSKRKLPSLRALKAQLQSGHLSALVKAEANGIKSIGRPRL